jgi:hypothetical protein
MPELLAVRGLERTDNAFRAELIRVAERLGADPNKLAAVMSFETGASFDPAQPNFAGGSAVGLIQFMPFAAKKMGTTSAKLAAMTGVEQLAYVEKYFRLAVPRVKGRLNTTSDHYLAVFAPIGVGKPQNYPLPYKGKKYQANKGLDRNRDGVITVAEATFPVAAILKAAEGKPKIAVDMRGRPAGGIHARPQEAPDGVVRLDLPAPRRRPRKALTVALLGAAAYAAAAMFGKLTKGGKRGV